MIEFVQVLDICNRRPIKGDSRGAYSNSKTAVPPFVIATCDMLVADGALHLFRTYSASVR